MRRFWLYSIVVLALGTSACQNPLVYNVEQTPLNAPASATIGDVERAILAAGTKRGWIMRVVDPGHIVASHTRGSHSATVDIFFTTATYSIAYKESTDLDYEDGRIHGTYNRWIEYLKRDIALYVQTI
jgi:hypothetical protein